MASMTPAPRRGFQLTFAAWASRTGLTLPDNLPYADWYTIGEQLNYVQGSVLWWLGDWANYGERKYGDLKKAADVTGYDHGTVRNAQSIASTFELSRRRDSLSYSHHAEVAALPEEEQEEWLDKAEAGKWGRAQLRQEMRSQRKALAPLALPPGIFDVIYADPPWAYDNQIEAWGSTSLHYDSMSLDALKGMSEKVTPRCAPDATLFLWVTNPFLEEGLLLAREWGFEYKTHIVWVKTGLQRPGSGFYVRGHHELLFICTRGAHVPDQLGQTPISSVLSADVQEHSKKPLEVYELIERIYPTSRYLELFLRGQAHPGWTGWGEEANG